MIERRNLLIEIGTEELPPVALLRLSNSFAESIETQLLDLGYTDLQVKRYATPRRLAVLIKNVPIKQEDQAIEKRGPALQAAYDANGEPTKAALGFAKSCNAELEQLEKLETDKGSWLVYRAMQSGKLTVEYIPIVVEKALAALPIPKRMRWGSGEAEFVRPVHWAVLLFGGEVINSTILGVQSGRETKGHRFHHPGAITIAIPEDYEANLKKGYVIADFEERRQVIKQQVEDQAKQLNGQSDIDKDFDLLDEVTALVEWPVAITCSFDENFLQVPQEALVMTMKANQKYFPIYNNAGKLTCSFVTISNITSKEPEQIREGNERVVRPRMADAAFFWEQDKRHSLESFNDSLKKVLFQKKLGSMYEKVERIAKTASTIAPQIKANIQHVQRAGLLCKADLMTEMVYEFPKLQGIMGRYYAINSQEDNAVAVAIEEHYLPRFAGDDLPQTDVGQCVAIAEKLDTLVGIFAAGQKPTGEKDPFALRRTAIGLLKIIIDAELDLDLIELLNLAASNFPQALNAEKVIEEVFEYIMNRLRGEYEGSQQTDFTPQEIESVLTCKPTKPLDFDKRIRAVKAFSALDEAESLSAANKRIRNILKKAKNVSKLSIDNNLFAEPAEKSLYQSIEKLLPQVEPLCAQGHYEKALKELSTLKEPVDRFFDEVMVMVEEENIKNNRLALLSKLQNAFLQIADVSQLQQ